MRVQSPQWQRGSWTVNKRNDGGFWGNPRICSSQHEAMETAAEVSDYYDDVIVTGPDGTDHAVYICVDRDGCRWGFAEESEAVALRDKLNIKWGHYGKAVVISI